MNSKILYSIVAVAFVGGLFSAVYAGPMMPKITLAGNVDVTGDLTVVENIETSGEFQYSPAKTRSVIIAPAELSGDSDTLLKLAGNGESAFIGTGSTDGEVFASIPNLPDGATITKWECRQVDNSGAFMASCLLRRASFLGSEEVIGSVLTDDSGFQTGSDTSFPSGAELVDRDMFSYYMEWSVNPSCNTQCGFISAKITFTVPQAD